MPDDAKLTNEPSAAEMLQQNLAEKHGDLVKRALDLLRTAETYPAEAATEEHAKQFSDFIGQLAGAWKTTEEAREAEKRPYLLAGRAVDGWFTALLGPLDTTAKPPRPMVISIMKRRLDKYLIARADRERREREEAEKKAREEAEAAQRRAAAAERAAADEASMQVALAAAAKAQQAEADAAAARAAVAAKPAEMSRLHGGLGSTSSLRTTWHHEVTDAAQLPRYLLMPNEALIAATIKTAPKNRDGSPNITIPGVKIFPRHASSTRG